MPLRITVRVDDGEGPSIVFDTPRLVIGRGEGADLRLPDASVSARHATVRQRGSEYLLFDEGSTNGTRLGAVRLGAHASRVIHDGDVVRVGRVFLAFAIEPTPPTPNPRVRAQEVALELVERALAAQSEDVRPVFEIVEGPDRGQALALDAEVSYVAGRSPDCALRLGDELASRRHFSLERRGAGVTLIDLGSKGGLAIGDREVTRGETPLRPGQRLYFGANEAEIRLPAVSTLAEIEREPDEKVSASELSVREEKRDAAREEVIAEDPAPSDTVEEGTSEALARAEEEPSTPSRRGRSRSFFGLAEIAVVLLAFGVLTLTAVGYVVLLK